jgi:hypothetical protein
LSNLQFAAAYAGVSEWAKSEWYRPDEMIEVQSGQKRWYVRARRVAEWHFGRAAGPSELAAQRARSLVVAPIQWIPASGNFDGSLLARKRSLFFSSSSHDCRTVVEDFTSSDLT